MTEYLLQLPYVLMTYAAGYAVQIYPMWKTRDIRARTVFIFIACLSVLQGAGLLFARQSWDIDITMLNVYIAIVGLPTSVVQSARGHGQRPGRGYMRHPGQSA